MSWKFRAKHPADVNVDPVQSAFFATEALDDATDALVRETIQNSLDAADEGAGQVEVRFSFTEGDATEFLDGLRPHVEGAFDREVLPPRGKTVRCLVIEDFGTRGLEGDVAQHDDPLGASRNDFYYFWRNVGRSSKSDSDRGRWGLGKTVFPAASKLHSFFGLTVRASDRQCLLMGQAVLRTHSVGGARYQPYGYFGRHDEQGFTRPFVEGAVLDRFREAFGVARKDEPGLSVVVPHHRDEYRRADVVRSVVRHYFHPLIAGKLRVVVADRSGRSVLDSDGIDREVARDPRLATLRPLVALTRWGITLDAERSVAQAAAPAAGAAAKWRDAAVAPEALESLRADFDAGREVAVDVGLWVHRSKREGDAALTRFRVLMQREDEQLRGSGQFVRRGITIENPKARRPPGVRWIVQVDDRELSRFLGDAENPAHTEWQRSSPKFKDRYHLGASTIDYLKAVPMHLARLLGSHQNERDESLLRSWFSLPNDAAVAVRTRQQPKPGTGEKESTDDVPPDTLGDGGSLVLERLPTGFRLVGRAGTGAPERLRVTVAYEVLRGDPFRRYSPLDFGFGESIAAHVDGAELVDPKENQLEIAITGAEFSIDAEGFDRRRDLRVRVRAVEDSA